MFGDIPCKTTRVQSEDCLSLDVYSATYNTFSQVPVMVWLHGGGRLTNARIY